MPLLIRRRLFLGSTFKSWGCYRNHGRVMNGRTQNPSYRDICYSDTGHAEAAEVAYDPVRLIMHCLSLFLALA